MLSILLNTISNTDREKVNACLALIAIGDESALTEIYHLVGGRLLSVALGIMRDRQLAEDVLHDGFIKIVRHIKKFRIGTNGYAWLCKIIRNTALNKIKSENIRRGEDIDSILDISDEKSLYNDSLVVSEVREAMKCLTKREKTIIWLKYYNDMTVREIASELNMKKSTVQDIIKIAERQLRQKLS